MNKLIRGVCTFAAAVALIAAPLAVGSAAVADEVTDPAVVQTVEETAPATDTTQAPAEVVDAPVVPEPEVVPTTPAEQPVQEPVDNAVQTTDAQPQAPPVQVQASVEAKTVKPEQTKTIEWILPNGGTASNVTWPQPIASKANLALVPCGTTVTLQVDVYPYTTKEDKKRTDALSADGILTQGEDYGWAQSWSFKTYTAPPCVVDVPAPTLTVLPPTCVADGSLPFLNNPAAQNPNGYEFPGEGYRVYISPAFSGAGTYTATIQRVGAGFDPAFPGGTKVIGNTTQTLTVLPATGHQSEDSTKPCYEAPTPANPKAEITAVCGAADITLTNPVVKDWAQITASYIVNVDGKFYGAYAVAAGESKTVELSFDEDSGDRKVEVFQAGTSEYKLIASETVETDCVAPVAAPPVFKDITCEEPGTFSIPSVDGVGYFFLADGNESWTHIDAGQYPVTEALIGQTVQFEARWIKDGSVLDNWEHTFTAPSEEDCKPVIPPTEEPPVVTPPTDTPKATPPVAPETVNLAATGADGGAILGWSLLAFGVIAGAIALIVTGRRKAQAIPVKSETDEV